MREAFESRNFSPKSLETVTLANIVRSEVLQLRGPDKWAAKVERETKMRAELDHFVQDYREREDSEYNWGDDDSDSSV
jgi:hypothetical protein